MPSRDRDDPGRTSESRRWCTRGPSLSLPAFDSSESTGRQRAGLRMSRTRAPVILSHKEELNRGTPGMSRALAAASDCVPRKNKKPINNSRREGRARSGRSGSRPDRSSTNSRVNPRDCDRSRFSRSALTQSSLIRGSARGLGTGRERGRERGRGGGGGGTQREQ